MNDIWTEDDAIVTKDGSVRLSNTPLFIVAAILDADKDGLTLMKGEIAKAIWDINYLYPEHKQRFKVHLNRARGALRKLGYIIRTEPEYGFWKGRRSGSSMEATRIWIEQAPKEEVLESMIGGGHTWIDTPDGIAHIDHQKGTVDIK